MKQFYIAAFFILHFSGLAFNGFSQSVSSQNFGFVENKGQIIDQYNKANTAVKFLLCRPGFNVQLRATGFSYDTYTDEIESGESVSGMQSIINSSQKIIHQPQFSQRHYHRVDVELLNCNKDVQLVAGGASTACLNYFTGIKEGGVQNVHHYEKVTYSNIYPNIDLEFFTRQKATDKGVSNGGVEYQFVVHAGGNVNDIQLAYNGANDVSLNNSVINVSVNPGTFTEKIPASYVKASGQKVSVSYKAIGGNVFSFQLPSNLPITSDLIIDPTPNLLWGTYYGGSGTDNGNGIAVDGNGNVYVTGYTESTNNIATAGGYQNTLGEVGYGDAFVAKFDPTGSTLLWGTYYGGGISYNNGDFGRTGYKYGSATAYALVVDAVGNVYITGQTSDSNGIATPGAYQTTFKNNGMPAFVAKFTTNGNLVWGTFYGKPYTDKSIGSNTVGQGIVLDATGTNIYIAGTTSDISGIATTGAYNTTFISGETCSGFIAKFDTSGKHLLWGTYFGDTSGTNISFANGLTLDALGNVYVTGYTGCTDLATSGAFHRYLTAGNNAFVAKLNPNLSGSSQLLWCTYYGGSVLEWGNAIAVDAEHNVYITGFTDSDTGIATKGAYQDTFKTYSESDYIAKLDSMGSKRIWGTYYGGGGFTSYGTGIVLDACKNVYVTGYTNCPGMATIGSYKDTLTGGGSPGNSNAFVAKFDSSAKSLLWGTYYGVNSSWAKGIVLNNGNVYITGTTSGTAAISTSNTWQNALAGGNDAMIAEFTNVGTCTECSLTLVQIISPVDSICAGNNITLSVYAPGSANLKYTWSPGGQHTSSIQVSPSLLTKYIVTVQDTIAGCSKKDSITIHVITGNVVPSVTISAPTTNICSGTLLTFTAASNNGGSHPSYRWRINNQDAGTNSTFTDTLSNNDVISCLLTSSIVCASPDTAKSNQITVTVTTMPSAGSITTSKDTVCEGTPHSLTLTGSSGNIQWQTSETQGNYTNASGANSTTFKPVILQNTYFRVYTSNGMCSDTSSATELYGVPPPMASYTDTANNLVVSFTATASPGVVSYNWDFGDNTSSTIKNPVHTFDSARVYYVCLNVTNNTNCSFTDCMYVNSVSTGINNVSPGNTWVIYPNPFSNQLYITVGQLKSEAENIQMIDVLGRVVLFEQLNNGIANPEKLDVSNLKQGVYYLIIKTQDGDYVKSLIKV